MAKNVQLFFHVRLKDDVKLTQLKSELEEALQCTFSYPDEEDSPIEYHKTMSAQCLGLELNLISEEYGLNDTSLYKLIGSVKPKLDFLWEENFETIDISEYIKAILNMCNTGDWYIPTAEEMYSE